MYSAVSIYWLPAELWAIVIATLVVMTAVYIYRILSRNMNESDGKKPLDNTNQYTAKVTVNEYKKTNVYVEKHNIQPSCQDKEAELLHAFSEERKKHFDLHLNKINTRLHNLISSYNKGGYKNHTSLFAFILDSASEEIRTTRNCFTIQECENILTIIGNLQNGIAPGDIIGNYIDNGRFILIKEKKVSEKEEQKMKERLIGNLILSLYLNATKVQQNYIIKNNKVCNIIQSLHINAQHKNNIICGIIQSLHSNAQRKNKVICEIVKSLHSNAHQKREISIDKGIKEQQP